MRHKLHKYRLGRGRDQRRALMANLSISLFDKGRIYTTLGSAKALRQFAERLITKAKSQDKLHAKRLIASKLFNNFTIANKLTEEIAKDNMDRPGGYTRIIKTGFRRGDGAPTALIELVSTNTEVLASKGKKA